MYEHTNMLRLLKSIKHVDGPLRFVIHRSKNREIAVGYPDHRQGFAACNYCGKQIVRWPSRKPGERAFTHDNYNEAEAHLRHCAWAWARRVLALDSAGIERHSWEIEDWREWLLVGDGYHGQSATMRLCLKLFDNLPQPIGSELTNAVEALLVGMHAAVSRYPSWWRDRYGL